MLSNSGSVGSLCKSNIFTLGVVLAISFHTSPIVDTVLCITVPASSIFTLYPVTRPVTWVVGGRAKGQHVVI